MVVVRITQHAKGVWVATNNEQVDSAPCQSALDAETPARAWANVEKGCYIRHKENGGISKIRLYGEWTVEEIRGILEGGL